MNRIKAGIIWVFAFFTIGYSTAQSLLTIEKIMQDPKAWVGTSPAGFLWSENGQKLYFNWNPDQNPGDSLYSITLDDRVPRKVDKAERDQLPSRFGDYNQDKSSKVYIKDGNVFLFDIAAGQERQVIDLSERISSVSFSADDKRLHFTYGDNLFSWEILTGIINRHTDFRSGSEPEDKKPSEQDAWLERDQLALISILNERRDTREQREAIDKNSQKNAPLTIYLDKNSLSNLEMSPDGRYISYTMFISPSGQSNTEVPDYVSESGYTEMLRARSKVGTDLSGREIWIYDTIERTNYKVETKDLPGIADPPDFYSDYERYRGQDSKPRDVRAFGPYWSENGEHAFAVFRSTDNKDRWIMLVDPKDGSTTLLDRQRDEAWIAGPGIGWSGGSGNVGWMPDNQSIWFQSERTGYSHLYVLDISSGKRKSLTEGKFEVYNPSISQDEKKWFFQANVDHPGVRHFYSLPIGGGRMEKLTFKEGLNDVTLSPDENMMAISYSYANQPPELYLKGLGTNTSPERITESQTGAWMEYPWRIPEFVTFKARDGKDVHARLYKPEHGSQGGPAVVFVHGAGYLQNAHKWWSGYFREYMFHNFLVDNGYTVIDIDYRASAGYGRDWRTAIYRHMGGWDLTDQVDGANYLVREHAVDANRIGIYGGSYGGFITLMALFNEPDVFAAGAALRPVTDWAHYNHSYTSNILNTPVQDSVAYRKSSPIYYAEGLEKPLLIAHGMIDRNVHYQDVVRLAQRLIELGKDNWEVAGYPLEGHGFVEPSSWTDEYKRIFKLFEQHLKE